MGARRQAKRGVVPSSGRRQENLNEPQATRDELKNESEKTRQTVRNHENSFKLAVTFKRTFRRCAARDIASGVAGSYSVHPAAQRSQYHCSQLYAASSATISGLRGPLQYPSGVFFPARFRTFQRVLAALYLLLFFVCAVHAA